MARLASSGMRPTRPIGFPGDASDVSGVEPVGFSLAQAPSVGKGPGAMALKRMPRPPHSTASDWVITFKPAFDIAEGTVNGPPFHTQVVRIEVTDPVLPSASQRLPQSRVTKNEPRK